MAIRVSPTISLDENELEENFVRASGPGGQNVNKVASAVQLRFDAENSPNLPPSVKRRLRALAGSRMTRDGVVIIEAERHRTQKRNREDALDRLIDLIRDAATPPKRRIATRPSLSAKRKRVDEKVQRGMTKKTRKRPTLD
jgi:ribosome-associated protein